MVGESILNNPCIFENIVPDPVLISLEYLEICKACPTASMTAIRTHVRHFVEHQCARRPWYSHFRAALNLCESVDEVEALLKGKVVRWRGKAGATVLRTTQDDSHIEIQGDGDSIEPIDFDLSDSSLF